MDAFARILIGMYHRRIEYPSGVRAREEILPADGKSSGELPPEHDVGAEEQSRLAGSNKKQVISGVSSDASS